MAVLIIFIKLGSKITADGDCSHEIRRRLLLGRKAMTNLDSVKKRRHHLGDRGVYSQGYGLSSSHVRIWTWTIKKAECRRMMLSNCGAGEDSRESLGKQGDQTSQP